MIWFSLSQNLMVGQITFGKSYEATQLNHFIPVQVSRGLNRKLAAQQVGAVCRTSNFFGFMCLWAAFIGVNGALPLTMYPSADWFSVVSPVAAEMCVFFFLFFVFLKDAAQNVRTPWIWDFGCRLKLNTSSHQKTIPGSTNTFCRDPADLNKVRSDVLACVLTAQQCNCSFAVCVVMCVTGHQSWLDPCTVAGGSSLLPGGPQGEKDAAWQWWSEVYARLCVCQCGCKWMNVHDWWPVLVVVGVTAGCFICSVRKKCRPVL